MMAIWQQRASDWAFAVMTRLQRRRLPESLPYELTPKRVYVIPTKFGLFFGGFLLLMTFSALNYNNNMALMLAYLLGGLYLLVPIYTVRNLTGLRLDEVGAEPAFAGQDATLYLTVFNTGSQNRPVVWAGEGERADVSDIAPTSRTVLRVGQSTTERGWQSVGRLRLSTRFPAGLFFAWSWVVPDARYLVYPAPEVDPPGLPTGDQAASGRPEREGDEEWAGLRKYQPGDPSRWIAWKAVARTGELVSKTFATHEGQRIELGFDRLVGLGTEQRLSRLCAWVLEADRQELDYSLILPQQRVGPGHGEKHRHQCLRALAES